MWFKLDIYNKSEPPNSTIIEQHDHNEMGWKENN